jgi:hypothetical protein
VETLFGNPAGKKPLVQRGYNLEDIIRMNIKYLLKWMWGFKLNSFGLTTGGISYVSEKQ